MSWVHVVQPTEIKGFDAESGKTIAVLDLQVSTASGLPAIGDVVENYIIAAGSNAQIVRASSPTFVTLDGDDGNWYPEQSDSSASTLNASLSAQLTLGKSPTLAKAVADSDSEYIDMTEPEVEAIRDELEEQEIEETEPTESEVTEDA